MRERPILFSAPMVRAILNGTKTQTRRVVKWHNVDEGLNVAFTGLRAVSQVDCGWVLTSMGGSSWEERCAPTPCPYGAPGDRLWVREAWAPCPDRKDGSSFIYAAGKVQRYKGETWRWRPSIHMPRAASRLMLEITDVRVERLQSCSDADAEAEGIGFIREHPDLDETLTPVQLYAALWDSINEERGHPWSSNPWVWVVSFRQVTAKATAA